MKIEVRRVETDTDWNAFIQFPWSVYADFPAWVPPLRLAVREQLDVNKNPFFRHAYLYPLLALKEGKVVGRAVGIVDEDHNRFHNEQVVFFGFFESKNEAAIAQALVKEIAAWGSARGMTRLRGPVNPSFNHEAGLLIEGYDDPPMVMMTYNPPYYASLLENAGLKKTKDLYAYEIKSENAKFSDRLLAHAERLRNRAGVSFRSANMSKFDAEVTTLLDIYNDAWEKNWGFVPMSPAEFGHLAKDLKLIVDPEMLIIAEIGGEPAGFALALPDVNQIQIRVRDGRLFPFGLLKLLWGLKGPGRRKMDRLRIVTLGIKKKFQHLSLGPLLYSEYLRRAPQKGYRLGEASWVLEDNRPMNAALDQMSFRRSKVYRIYEKLLS